MKLISILVALAASVICSSSGMAEIQFGLNGQTGWSDNRYLDNPKGWGVFASKSLSQRVSIQASFNHFGKEFRYIGVMLFGFPPPDADTTRELINSDASVNIYEFTLQHVLIENNRLSWEAGAGIGTADFDLTLHGLTTAKRESAEADAAYLTLSTAFTVKRFIVPPVALRLGYQYRAMTTGPEALDAFTPFGDVELSNIYAAVVASW